MTVQVRGKASEELATLVDRARAARQREADLRDRKEADRLKQLRERRVELLQEVQAAALDGKKKNPSELSKVSEELDDLAARLDRHAADEATAARLERESRDTAMERFVEEHRDDLVAEIVPAVLGAEQEMRAHLQAAIEAHWRLGKMAFGELDPLCRSLPGVTVRDSSMSQSAIREIERLLAASPSLVPRALLDQGGSGETD